MLRPNVYFSSTCDVLSMQNKGRLTLQKIYPGDESTLAHDCDILVPCGSSYILTEKTIPCITAKIICGAANNQLQSPIANCKMLESQGSTYVVDFVANRMVSEYRKSFHDKN